MKQNSKLGRMVADLRKVIGKTQSQFAAMIGVSKDAVISVENDRNQLSWNMARRIYIATGANLRSDVHYRTIIPGKTYFEKDFEVWRNHYYPGDSQTAKVQFDRMKFWIELVFKAAARPGVAGNRDRLPAVHLSLVEWLRNTHDDFKLEKEIDQILEEETRYVGEESFPIWQIKLSGEKFDEPYVEKLAKRLGVPYDKFIKELKSHEELDEIVIKDEFRRDWVDMFTINEPLEEQKLCQTPCTKRKFMAKPKYWFRKADVFGNPIT